MGVGGAREAGPCSRRAGKDSRFADVQGVADADLHRETGAKSKGALT